MQRTFSLLTESPTTQQLKKERRKLEKRFIRGKCVSGYLRGDKKNNDHVFRQWCLTFAF